MALNPTILTTDVDALSPLDEYLMGAIRTNLDELDSVISGGALSPIIQFKLNGPLDALANGRAKRIDSAYITNEQTLNQCILTLDKPGTSGTLEVDLREITTPKVPITGIEPIYSAAIQSISRAGSAYATQSITRTTTQIPTQSITHFRSSILVESIIGLGGNLWQYNLANTPDEHWAVGDRVEFNSCTAATNNGRFTIVRLNDYGSKSIIVSNASGVEQAGAAGSALLLAYTFNFANPVSTEFVAGEQASFASHTDAANNGTKTIYAVNLGGNNIVVKGEIGGTQNGAAGTVDVLRFSYNFSIPAPSADYLVGDTLNAASHTSAGNNGNFRITAVNLSGNNIQVYNPSGVLQGGIAGSVNSNQWIIALPTDPSAEVIVGDELWVSGASTGTNNGQFTVRQVKRAALNNVTVFNVSGVAQVGIAGTVLHTKKRVKFASDQAESFSTDSWIEIEGTPSSFYTTPNYYDVGHQVLEINRGGGANYNVVIKVNGAAPSQNAQAGWVSLESRSVFTTTPKIVISPEASKTLGQTQVGVQTVPAVIRPDLMLAQGSKVSFYVLSCPAGAETIGVQVR
jgi:hypothetical protein